MNSLQDIQRAIKKLVAASGKTGGTILSVEGSGAISFAAGELHELTIDLHAASTCIINGVAYVEFQSWHAKGDSGSNNLPAVIASAPTGTVTFHGLKYA